MSRISFCGAPRATFNGRRSSRQNESCHSGEKIYLPICQNPTTTSVDKSAIASYCAQKGFGRVRGCIVRYSRILFRLAQRNWCVARARCYAVTKFTSHTIYGVSFRGKLHHDKRSLTENYVKSACEFVHDTSDLIALAIRVYIYTLSPDRQQFITFSSGSILSL